MSQHLAGAGSRSLLPDRPYRATGWRLRAAVVLALAVLGSAVHAGAASAHTQIVAPEADQQVFFQSWVDGSLMPTPDTHVAVTGSICPGGQLMSCSQFSSGAAVIAFPDVRYLFAAPYTADTLDQTRVHLEFMHELGHVYDWAQSHNGALRAGFLRVMRITGSGVTATRWTTGQIGNQTVNPADVFAMAYSYCSVYPTLPTAVLKGVYWGYGFNPAPRQYAQACALLGRAGATPVATGATPVAAAARRR